MLTGGPEWVNISGGKCEFWGDRHANTVSFPTHEQGYPGFIPSIITRGVFAALVPATTGESAGRGGTGGPRGRITDAVWLSPDGD